MAAQWNTDGSLTLSWTEPSSGYFDQYRVYLTDQSGKVLFFGLVLPGVNQVTLSASLVQQISQNAQITGATSVNWNLRTRSISSSYGHNNYAQGISDSVVLPWPAP